MKVLQIASGSKGNCTFITTNTAKILLDCGISKKEWKKPLVITNLIC